MSIKNGMRVVGGMHIPIGERVKEVLVKEKKTGEIQKFFLLSSRVGGDFDFVFNEEGYLLPLKISSRPNGGFDFRYDITKTGPILERIRIFPYR